MHDLGMLHLQGKDVPRDDVKAFELFRSAAEGGIAEAQCFLGWMCAEGKGLEAPDLPQAVHWYHEAAAQGLSEALFQLALIFLKGGGGVQKDEVHCIELLERASAAGHGPARKRLSLLRLMLGRAAGAHQRSSAVPPNPPPPSPPTTGSLTADSFIGDAEEKGEVPAGATEEHTTGALKNFAFGESAAGGGAPHESPSEKSKASVAISETSSISMDSQLRSAT